MSVLGTISPLLAARVLQLAGGFLVSVVLVGRYGLPAVGTYALAAVGASVACLLCQLGLANALPRRDLPDGQRATIALALTLPLLVPLALAAAAYGWAIGTDGREAAAIAAFAFGGCFLGLVNVQNCLIVLQGRLWAAPIAPALHLAAILPAAMAPDVAGFAMALTALRAIGSLAAFVPLDFTRTSLREIRATALSGAAFVPLDLLALLGEQLPVLVLSAFLGRAELGLIGLARQFVAMADTPGWSYVQAEYPRLVRQLRATAAAIGRRNQILAWASGAATAVAAAAMAFLVYRSPQLMPVLALMLLPLPARYLNHFCDQILRAAGRVADSGALAAVKLVVSLGLHFALAQAFGFWGAVVAAALLSGIAGLLYRWRVVALFPGLLPPFRPWRMA